MGDATRAVPASPTPEQHSPLQAVLPHVLRSFKREPALALTAGYLFVALAGIYYDYWFYGVNFGIPVLTLSQISDFLVAGLQQPVALALVALTLPLCWIFDRINTYFSRKHAARRERLRLLPSLTAWQRLQLFWIRWNLSEANRRFSQFVYLVVVVAYSWMFVAMFASHRADTIRHGAGPKVGVRLTGEHGDLQASTSSTWSYLGAVSNYVFVYDPADKRALVLPVNAIQRIQPVAEGKPGLSLPVVRLP
jgi:hypothetical protein